MFNDIGEKIKRVATSFCIIGIILSIVGALILIFTNSRYNPTLASGLTLLVVGPLASWLGSLTLYGFGELIDLTRQNNQMLKTHFTTKPISTPANPSTPSKPEYIHHDSPAPVMKSGQATDLDVSFLRSLRSEQDQEN